MALVSGFNRRRFLALAAAGGAAGAFAVVLSGDAHRSVAADPGSATVGAEFLATSLSSGATGKTWTRGASSGSPRTRT